MRDFGTSAPSDPSCPPSLEARGLHFTYGSPPQPFRWLMGRRAAGGEVLKGLDFSLAGGSRACLMGANGAGKSTLLKILLGILPPTQGSALTCGLPAEDPEAKERTGFVHPDERSFYWRLTVRENLLFFGRLWGMSGQNLSDRISETSSRLQMEDILERPFGELSTGQRQRVAIGRALLRSPAILIMDEPTRSLDPAATSRLHELILGPALAGRTILVATHRFEEARVLAPRCMILSAGRLAYDGPSPPEEDLQMLMGRAS